jgi:hypothetical protein
LGHEQMLQNIFAVTFWCLGTNGPFSFRQSSSLSVSKVFRLSVSIHPTIKKEISAFFLLGKITAEIFFLNKF